MGKYLDIAMQGGCCETRERSPAALTKLERLGPAGTHTGQTDLIARAKTGRLTENEIHRLVDAYCGADRQTRIACTNRYGELRTAGLDIETADCTRLAESFWQCLQGASS